MINYNPADATQVLPAGDYPATLIAVEEKVSKKGNDMLELSFKAWGKDRHSTVFEYIVFPTFVWKLKRLARAFGAEAEFEAGTFDPEKYIQQNLTLTLDVEEQERFEPKNVIKAYGPKQVNASAITASDDANDLPF